MSAAAPRFHRLAVNDLRRETADAVSMTFSIPSDLADDYSFAPGQYLTLRTTMDGEEVRRSYSICSGPDDGELRIAVKKLDGGAFSSWAADELKAGDELDVMTPTGRFGVTLAPEQARIYVGFAAGSGITPVLSIVKGVLAREPKSRFFLFYGNRSSEGVMFCEELEELKDRFLQRFSLFHVISGEEQDIPILHGRLDGEKVRVLLRSLVPAASVDHVFICGPTGMSDELEATCRDIGIAEDRIHVERFVSGLWRQAASEEGRRAECAAEGVRLADHRWQAERGAGRRGRGHPRCCAARRRRPAVRLQGRHVLDLSCQAGRGRGADGAELFAGAVGAEGGLYPDLPGQAGFRKGRSRLRSRVIVIPGRCVSVEPGISRFRVWC
jgi:ferredoxin-NADP reductase